MELAIKTQLTTCTITRCYKTNRTSLMKAWPIVENSLSLISNNVVLKQEQLHVQVRVRTPLQTCGMLETIKV